MFKFLNKYKNSEFGRNVLKLASGTTIAQIIAISCAPIVYRIYDRADYGLLGLFMAITSVISVFSTLQYSNTILIADDEEEARLALKLNRIISILISIICFLLVVPAYFIFIKGLGYGKVSLYFFLIPIAVFFTGQNGVFRIYANRKKEYNVILKNTILIAVISPLLSIPLGLIFDGPFGLFFSLIAGQILPYTFLFIKLNSKYDIKLTFNDWERMLSFARKNIEFPKYILPSYFLGRFSRQLPVFMIERFFGLEIVGVYNLAVRIIDLPIQLLTNSITEVFSQKVAYYKANKMDTFAVFKKTFIVLFSISIIPIIVINLFGTELFAFVFGKKWIESGELAKVLIWQYAFQMIVGPLSYLFILNKKLVETFFVHLYMLVSNLLIFIVAIKYFSLELTSVLFYYVINSCLINFYYLCRSAVLSQNKKLILN